MKLRVLGIAGITVAIYAVPASAHHSGAMFDAAKTVTLEGEVKEFQWTNPHAWIVLMVRNQQGQPDQWPIELGAPANLAPLGWRPKTLTPGMKVTATFHPLRNGKFGGQFMSVTLPDGKVMANRSIAAVYGQEPAKPAAGGNTQ